MQNIDPGLNIKKSFKTNDFITITNVVKTNYKIAFLDFRPQQIFRV